jgi:ATP-dependent DNA helicase RecG
MLTRQQVEQILDDILKTRTELDEAECKTSAATPLQHALCALSNRRDRNGGVAFVGVDENYQIVGVPDIEQTQQLVSDWATDVFNVPLRVVQEILEYDGKSVLAVIVPCCPSGARPCHFKRHNLYDSAYIRVGNSTRLMTRDEVRREIADDEVARGTVLPFDRLPYLQATMDDLDTTLIENYIAQVKKIRPGSTIDRQPRDQMMRDLHAVVEHDGQLRPTNAGLLFFCAEPQRHLPQSSVEFLHLWGRDITTPGPDGSKWRTNREFKGTLPQIIDELEALLLERVDKRGFIDSFRRRDEPEYPRIALREAIINAVAHRDYTMRGMRVQVRLFSDRIEVDTPGGLPAPVTVDNIEDEKSTRNEAIVGLLENINYVERRGWGFNNMVSAMRVAGLAPPLLRDNGASFGLCLKSHVLMSPEGVVWLRRFDGFDLSPQEKLALAYLRINERLYNRDYVRLNECTATEATQTLRRMTDKGVVQMRGRHGGAYYVLPEQLPESQPNLLTATLTDEERVIALAKERGSISRRDVVAALDLEPKTASVLLLRLKRRKQLLQYGSKRYARYTPA